jgi:hypothetical protein
MPTDPDWKSSGTGIIAPTGKKEVCATSARDYCARLMATVAENGP